MLRPGHRLGPGQRGQRLVPVPRGRRRPGTPGIPAAAPASRTGHQAGPHTPPAGPAPQDKADVASSHTPERVTPLLPGVPQIPPRVNKLPLGVNPIRPKMRGLFACWRNACIDAIKADPEEKLCILARLYLGISSLPPFLGRNRRLAQLVTDQAAGELLGKSIVVVGESDLDSVRVIQNAGI